MDKDILNSDFFKNLPEELKEKFKECKSEEEAMEMIKNNAIEIPDELLDKVAGGIYTPSRGDSREEMSSDTDQAKDFEEGRITGEDFF